MIDVEALRAELGAPPAPILPGPIDAATRRYWDWFFNGPAHDPDCIQRHDRWEHTDISEFDRFGGLAYQWLGSGGLSMLTLWTPGGGPRRSRSAATDNPIPPFSLLTRCWFDLCYTADLIDRPAWEAACAELEPWREWERPEYGDCWQQH